MGPLDAERAVGTRAGATVFSVIRGLLVGGVAPVVPSFGTYVRAEFTVDVNHFRIGSPGAAEINFADTGAAVSLQFLNT